MLTFKELFIKTDNANMEKFITALTAKISQNQIWSRKEDKENRILGADTIYNFQRQKDSNLPSAGLSIFPKNEGMTWYVPNVVPLEYGQLSCQEYNDILTEFYHLFIKPTSDELKIEAEISTGEVDAVDILGEEAARALSLFSDCANKSTGSSHPCDRERWLDFIYKSCMPGRHVDIGLLEKLLIEQGWDEYWANKLVIQFEFGRDLVEYIKENS